MDKTLWLILSLTALILGLCVWAIISQSEECEERGGELVGTGHYTTIFVKSGQVMIPLESETYECTVE